VLQVRNDVVMLECGPDKAKLVFARNAIGSVEGVETENSANELISGKTDQQ
jgi:hypothetical protein